MEKFTLTKARYKEIKSMNRTQMEKFLADIYDSAYRDGYKVGSNKFIELLDRGLQACKGIGKIRYSKIMDAINEQIKDEISKESSENNKGN